MQPRTTRGLAAASLTRPPLAAAWARSNRTTRPACWSRQWQLASAAIEAWRGGQCWWQSVPKHHDGNANTLPSPITEPRPLRGRSLQHTHP